MTIAEQSSIGDADSTRSDRLVLDSLLLQSKATFAAIVVIGGTFVYISIDQTQVLLLTCWYAAVIATTLARGKLHARWVRELAEDARPPSEILLRFYVGIGVSGALWGFLGSAFFVADDPYHQAMTTMLLAGMSAGAAAAYFASRAAIMLFLFPAIVPLSCSLAWSGHTDLALMCGLYVLLMSKMSSSTSKSARSGFDLRIKLEVQRVELLATQEKLRVALSAKSDFLATMSHEIRTPLNGIIGLNELLLGTTLNSQQKDLARDAKTCGDALLVLVNDILDLSKLEAGGLSLKSEPFEIRPWMKESIQMFSTSARCKGLSLEGTVDASVPAGLLGDGARLRQVVANLLGNAVKFTNEGSVELKLTYADQDGVLRIAVKDTGIGIANKNLKGVFNAFEQSHEADQVAVKGTGLGLSISRRITEAMGGRVWAESTLGEGSSFLVEVPLVATRVAKPAAPRTDRAGLVPGLKVLVVDDNLINRKVAAGILGRMGIDPTLATDGQQACEMFANAAFDLVLMDCQMPVMDGYQATARIRALPGGADITIVALTANALDGDRERCLEAGMNEFLSKPMVPEELRKILESFS